MDILSYILIWPKKWSAAPLSINVIIWFPVIYQTWFVSVHFTKCEGIRKRSDTAFFVNDKNNSIPVNSELGSEDNLHKRFSEFQKTPLTSITNFKSCFSEFNWAVIQFDL